LKTICITAWRFPTATVEKIGRSDDDEDKPMPWGMSVKIDCETGGGVGFAEPSGNSFATWRDHLDKLKEKIAQKGLEIVLEGGCAKYDSNGTNNPCW